MRDMHETYQKCLTQAAFTPSQWSEYQSICTTCYGTGWIEVGKALTSTSWGIYRFPCKCTFPHGLELWQLLDGSRLTNTIPDRIVSEPDLRTKIHPHSAHHYIQRIMAALRLKRQEMQTLSDFDENDLPF